MFLAWENSQHFTTPPPVSLQVMSDQWAHTPFSWRVTAQIWVVMRHQYGISALVSQMSFRRETSAGVAKCRLFSQAMMFQAFLKLKHKIFQEFIVSSKKNVIQVDVHDVACTVQLLRHDAYCPINAEIRTVSSQSDLRIFLQFWLPVVWNSRQLKNIGGCTKGVLYM